jgi:large subunit ribosomal protein L3
MNLQILKIGTKPEEINMMGGFPYYGSIRSTHVLVKGSVPGPRKRMVILAHTLRPVKKDEPLPSLTYISLQSNQGR